MQSHFQPSATSQVPKSPNYMFCLLSWISSHNCLILAASTQSCISDPTGLQRLEPHVSVHWGSLNSSKLGVTSLPPPLVTQPVEPAQDAPRYQPGVVLAKPFSLILWSCCWLTLFIPDSKFLHEEYFFPQEAPVPQQHFPFCIYVWITEHKLGIWFKSLPTFSTQEAP